MDITCNKSGIFFKTWNICSQEDMHVIIKDIRYKLYVLKWYKGEYSGFELYSSNLNIYLQFLIFTILGLFF